MGGRVIYFFMDFIHTLKTKVLNFINNSAGGDNIFYLTLLYNLILKYVIDLTYDGTMTEISVSCRIAVDAPRGYNFAQSKGS